MKKNLFLIPILGLLLLLSSCLGESYQHQVSIVYPYNVSVLYADQTADSIAFTTFDSYSVTTYNSDWIKVKSSDTHPSSATIQNTYYNYYYATVYLDVEPNLKSTLRNGYVNVRSYSSDWDQTANGYYKQTGWHNILKPAPAYGKDANNSISTCEFIAQDSCLQLADTLRFITYDAWTLEQPEGGFVKVRDNQPLSGKAGSYTLLLDVERNDSKDARQMEMKLKTSNGPVTPITFKQDGTEKKTE